MMLRFFFTLVSLISVSATKYKLCGGPDPLIEVTSVQLSPLYPGKPLSISYAAESKVDIENYGVIGYVDVLVFGLKLVELSFDFCDGFNGLQCPIAAGTPFEGKMSYDIPSETPEGVDLTVRISVKDENSDTELSCIELDVRVERILLEELDYATPLITSALVSKVNEASSSWISHMSPRFRNFTLEDGKRINKTVLKWQTGYQMLLPKVHWNDGNRPAFEASPHFDLIDPFFSELSSDNIPNAFDARDAWPECSGVIGRIRDQSDCGACWAFASTEAFNDRMCIKSMKSGAGSPEMTVLSAEDTLSCCRGLMCGLSMGCNGGQPGSAWSWFVRRGVVSGLDYLDLGKGTSCKPYEFKPCAHHVDPNKSGYPECSSNLYPTPSCVSECSDTLFSTSFDDDKHYATKAYSLRSVSDIQRDMMLHGPVTAAFGVYSDFMTYESGVYQHVTGAFLGGHAVKIIGWGVDEDSGLDYWLIVNSWNDSWGEDGLFRIVRGINECGIESQVVAGEA